MGEASVWAGQAARGVRFSLFVLLVSSTVGTAQEPLDGLIRVSSPLPGQQVARGQDLVVKYAIAEDGRRCSVVLVVNGRVLSTRDGCKASVAVPEHELTLGSNSVELFRQGEEDEQEAAVTFAVVEPPPWPSGTVGGDWGNAGGGGSSGEGGTAEESCRKDDARCSRQTCIHRVADSCILYEDTWAKVHGAVPRILHWVWVGGGGPIPDKFHPMMESWRRLHPDWQTVIWTDDLVTWQLRNQALILQVTTLVYLHLLVSIVYKWKCICVYLCAHVHMYAYIYTQSYTHAHVCASVCMYMYKQINLYTHTYVYT